ncbi:MAG: hypothetical protein GY833_22215 [Aestuariibacter sp.]|nr:hypothetical protein [Aestuariibacter sp.]|tara:strand:- start:23725 stop:24213 length:489 start_codon:yes stop_codon:yes gene_type:complete
MKQLNTGVGILGLQGLRLHDTADPNTPRTTPEPHSNEVLSKYTVVPLEAVKQLLSASQYVCQSGGTALSHRNLKRAGQAFDKASRPFGDPNKMTHEGAHLRDIGAQLDEAIDVMYHKGECNPYNTGMLNGMLFVRQMLTGIEEPQIKPMSCKLLRSETDDDD